MAGFDVDPDIRRARTPDAALYVDRHAFRQQCERVLERSWLFAATGDGLAEVGTARPWTFLPGLYDEPLLFARDLHDELRCLSNVCTHRGNLIVEGEWNLETLRCRVHGRRFHLDGTFAYMPCMQGAENFPTEEDYLPRVPLHRWRDLLFCSLSPQLDAEEVFGPLEARVAALGAPPWVPHAAPAYDLELSAHWALVCERLLEGFHASRQQEALTEPGSALWHPTETWEHGSVRVGLALGPEPVFLLPAGHPDRGERVAVYEFHLFPTTFLRVFPWGMLIQVVEPVAIDKTRVRSRVFVADGCVIEDGFAGRLRHGAGEDREIVESVQRGVRAKLFRGGRYSPEREVGIHHFHRQLASWMSGNGSPKSRRWPVHTRWRAGQRELGEGS